MMAKPVARRMTVDESESRKDGRDARSPLAEAAPKAVPSSVPLRAPAEEGHDAIERGAARS
jgi:hypothetical protein